MKKLEMVVSFALFFALTGVISMLLTWLSTISPWLSLGMIGVMAVIAMIGILIIEERNGTE